MTDAKPRREKGTGMTTPRGTEERTVADLIDKSESARRRICPWCTEWLVERGGHGWFHKDSGSQFCAQEVGDLTRNSSKPGSAA